MAAHTDAFIMSHASAATLLLASLPKAGRSVTTATRTFSLIICAREVHSPDLEVVFKLREARASVPTILRHNDDNCARRRDAHDLGG